MDTADNGRAIAFMTLSTAAFISNDALVKLTSEFLSLGQILVIRGCFGVVFLAIACHFMGVFRHFDVLRDKAVALRTFAEIMATLLYLTALLHIPIGNGTAILQFVPLVVTAGAAIFLKAIVGWRRWSAIAIGFIGALMIVQPGLDGFNAWSISALAGVVFIAVRDLATQRMPKAVPTMGVVFLAMCGVSILGIVLCFFQGWRPVPAQSYAMLGGSAILIITGYITLIISLRLGEISVVAPFRYVAILWALLWGYFLWGDVPDFLTSTGILIIVLTGIYSFWREQRLSRRTFKPQTDLAKRLGEELD